jgi:hypothetical protein
MYKTIAGLLLLCLLNTPISANITEKDVQSYLSVSRGKALIKSIFLSAYNQYFFIIYNKDMKNSNEDMLKKYRVFIFNPKYEDDLLNILSQFNDNTYFRIMEFYKTDLGKKYTKTFEKLYTNNLNTQLLMFLKEKTEKKISKKRIKLILKINKALNYIQLQTNLKKISFISNKSKGMQKDKMPSSETVDIFISEYEAKLKDNLVILSIIAYKDFNDEELLQILKYVEKYGHIEMELVYKALSLYTQHFYKDLYELIEKEKNTKQQL